MASPLKHDDTRAALFADIERLRGELVEREREAGELLDGEDAANDATNRVSATRMLLDAAKDRYIAENEAALAKKCPIHGSHALIVTCADCARAWDYSQRRATA